MSAGSGRRPDQEHFGVPPQHTSVAEERRFPGGVGDHGAVTWDPDVAAGLFFRACEPETARWAAARLRPQVWTTSQEITPLERWPDCEIVSIVCADDEVLAPDWSRRIARDVLRIEPVELPGGHSPMLSHPSDLANALTR